MTIEYRARPVTRYIVTRHETHSDRQIPTTRQIGNEFDNPETAYAVAYALARKEQEDLGLMPGDMGMIFPEMPKGAGPKPVY